MDLSKHLFFNEKFTLLLEKNMPKLQSFKTLRCGLKFVSPRHKILSYLADILIMILRMNGLRKKYTRVEKTLVMVLLFSKLLNHN